MKKRVTNAVRFLLQAVVFLLWIVVLAVVLAWLIGDSTRTSWFGWDAQFIRQYLTAFGISFEPLFTFLEVTLLGFLTWLLGRLPKSGVSPPTHDGAPASAGLISDPVQMRRAHNRQAMIQLVRRLWAGESPEQLLLGMPNIPINLCSTPQALDDQWRSSPLTLAPPVRYSLSHAKIADIFQDFNRSLLILGEAGSGKTTLLLELTRALLQRAEADSSEPIPVVLNLSSWPSRLGPVDDWIISELSEKYYVSPKITRDWLANDALALMLDGLDDLTIKRKECINALNSWLLEHPTGLALCSTTSNYQQLGVKAHVHGAVTIEPLDPELIDTYLSAAQTMGYTTLKEAIDKEVSAVELLRTPLMLRCLVASENPESFKAAKGLESDLEKRRYIFSAYTQRMFEHQAHRLAYSPPATMTWLSWLATKLTARSEASFRIEELQSSWLGSRTLDQVFSFLGTLSYLLLFYVLFGPVLGVLLALIAAMLQQQWERPLLRRHLTMMLSAAAVAGVLFSTAASFETWMFYAIPTGFTFEMDDGSLATFSPPVAVNALMTWLAVGSLFTLLWVLVRTLYLLADADGTGPTGSHPAEHNARRRIHWSWRSAVIGLVAGLGSATLFLLGNALLRSWAFVALYTILVVLLYGATNTSPERLGLGSRTRKPTQDTVRAWATLITSIMTGTVVGFLLELTVAVGDATLWGLCIGFTVGLQSVAAKSSTADQRLVKTSLWSWNGAAAGALAGAVVGGGSGLLMDMEFGIVAGDLPATTTLAMLMAIAFGLAQGIAGSWGALLSTSRWSWKSAGWGLALGTCGGAVLYLLDTVTGKPMFGIIFGAFDTPYTAGQLDETIVPIAAVVTALLFGVNGRLVDQMLVTRRRVVPVHRLHWSWADAFTGLLTGTIAGFVISLVIMSSGVILNLSLALALRLPSAFQSGVSIGLIAALVNGLRGLDTVPEDRFVVQPNIGMWRSATYACCFGTVGGALGWVIGGERLGLVIGVSFWLLYGGDAVVKHLLLRLLLWLSGHGPLHYAKFLRQCVELTFLRQAGGGFEFMHPQYRQHLANLDSAIRTGKRRI